MCCVLQPKIRTVAAGWLKLFFIHLELERKWFVICPRNSSNIRLLFHFVFCFLLPLFRFYKSHAPINKCGWFSWSGKLCTWLRSTSGKCKRSARPPPSPPFCSLGRSTSNRSRRRRSTSRCRRVPASRRCPISSSSRRNWANSRSRLNLSWTEPCARDCKASTGSCTSCGRCPASVPCCWWGRAKLRRNDPSNCRRRRGRTAISSSRSAPYRSRSFRDICTPVSSPSKRAANRNE